MVTTALKTNADAFQLPVKLFPREVIWNNFPEAMAKIPYVRYMMNTIFITLLSVVGQMIATPLVAYSLAKIKWKGAPIISALIMGTMMIPYTVTMIPLYKIWSRLGFTNTYVPLILPTFFGSPFYIIIMRQFFAGLPNSLMEAAKIDGANGVQRFFRIVLPYMKSVIKVTVSMSIIENFKQFPLFWTMTGGGPNNSTTTMAILSYREAFVSNNFGSGAAVTTVWMLMMIVVVYIYNRIFKSEDM